MQVYDDFCAPLDRFRARVPNGYLSISLVIAVCNRVRARAKVLPPETANAVVKLVEDDICTWFKPGKKLSGMWGSVQEGVAEVGGQITLLGFGVLEARCCVAMPGYKKSKSQ